MVSQAGIGKEYTKDEVVHLRHLLSLVIPSRNIPRSMRNAYWKWLESSLLLPTRDQDPDLYRITISWLGKQLSEVLDGETESQGEPKPETRPGLANVLLSLIPPVARESLLDDEEFRKQNGISIDVVLTLGDHGLSARDSDLFAAVRKALSGEPDARFYDLAGEGWTVARENLEDGEASLVAISGAKVRLALGGFFILSPDASERVGYLEEVAREVGLPEASVQAWRTILTNRAADDGEVHEFHRDVGATPTRVARAIASEIASGKSEIATLVPASRNYFERLVGAYDGAGSASQYATGAARKHFESLFQWDRSNGMLLGLLLSSHSSLIDEIPWASLSNNELEEALGQVCRGEETLSGLGAIEIGLRALGERPELESSIVPLVSQIGEDDPSGTASQFKLLSALFTLVDGELSRTRILSEVAPFYRRMASLAQAALIQRSMRESELEVDEFSDRAVGARGQHFYLQAFADMRSEPRWSSEFAGPHQLKMEFLGRILAAAGMFEAHIPSGPLHDLVLGSQPRILGGDHPSAHLYLPGPLDGPLTGEHSLPEPLAERIDCDLAANDATPASFVAFINAALVFGDSPNSAARVASILALNNHRLVAVDDGEDLFTTLSNLALAAAALRSTPLADEIRIVVRRYLHDVQYRLHAERAMIILLTAAASRAAEEEWLTFVGDAFTELAFHDLEGDEVDRLYSHLTCLLQLCPQLWTTCAKAHAALLACKG